MEARSPRDSSPDRSALRPVGGADTEAGGPAPGLFYRATIRLIDIAVAGAVLLLSSPILLVIATFVRLDSPGPALFGHQRAGLNRRRCASGTSPGRERRKTEAHGRPFTCYKFRTMYTDARDRFPELYTYRYTDEELSTLPIKILVGTKRNPADFEGPIESGSAGPEDPRITRVGRWLRRSSLDELPNLWNVLIGDMHAVGPRPDMEENIRYYSARELCKLDVKPGVTGLAQIRGRGNLSFRQTNELDIEYVETRSLLLDLKILIKTPLALLTRDGAA